MREDVKTPATRTWVGCRVLGAIACVAMLLSATGCATASKFWTDRKRDAADVFTASVGVGAGVKGRVGPFHAGVLSDVTVAGLRGGQLVGKPDYYDHGRDIDKFSVNQEIFSPAVEGGRIARMRGKTFVATSRMQFNNNDLRPWAEGLPFPYYYYTQIELVMGLGGNLRLGFNPGELADFCLGWFDVDIYHDDIGLVKSYGL